MKVYLVKDVDFEKLLSEIDRNPKHGKDGGSSQVFSSEEGEAFQKAHRFYNYVIRKWIQQVKQ